MIVATEGIVVARTTKNTQKHDLEKFSADLENIEKSSKRNPLTLLRKCKTNKAERKKRPPKEN